MLEVVFSEGAAGSLSVAMSRGTYIGGAVGVICHTDNDTKPEESEIQKVQERYERQQREGWAQAVELDGCPEEDILLFPLGLSVGQIDEGDIGVKRADALRLQTSTYPSDAEKIVQTDLEKAAQSLKTLLKRGAAGESIRIWSSCNADEACGLYWLMDQLCVIGFSHLDVVLVKLPDFYERFDGAVVRYSGWGEMEPYRWGKMAELGQKLPVNAMQAMADQWRRLKKENAPLRVVLNGVLVSAPENIYDTFILREIDCQEGTFKEAEVVGSVLGRYQLGIGDAWIAMRIESFIQQGLLEPLAQSKADEPIYRRMVRKCK